MGVKMRMCKECIFSEDKNSEYVYCKNFERCMHCKDGCTKFIKNIFLTK